MSSTTQKELKQPDSFLSLADRISEYASENATQVAQGAIAIVVLVLSVIGIREYRAATEVAARDDLSAALLAHSEAEAAGSTASQFASVAEANPSTPWGRLARLMEGSELLAAGNVEGAKGVFEELASSGDDDFVRQSANYNLVIVEARLGNQDAAAKLAAAKLSAVGPMRSAAALVLAAGETPLDDATREGMRESVALLQGDSKAFVEAAVESPNGAS